ncbi:uncharacterized protein LOC124274698 isoform X2 [Haliotis rubra]|uniref:uncharacterized protein LOC124274698 isoform X2 n=1 Tax=Haliotis rubra TaxID=36100 RepID=UPI001EE61590|nr:uncharacterized protein LOC124274698 isoform X2 [Haliotis rubra]
MVDVQLYCHAIWSRPRIPIYSDYYLPEKDIRDMKNRLIYWGKDRVWGLDVWRDLQERRRWAVANGPSLSLDINVNPRRRRNCSSENASASGFMLGLSNGIYLTHRIRRPCTVDIPRPLISVNIRDGVCLCKGRARLERVRRRSPFSPAVVAIHLDLPDEEPSRKFKDLSNHLARVVEEPGDRGIFFWFIKRGQWNTPIRGTSAYFIDLDGKHKKYKIHARDCIKFVVVLSERTHLSSPLPSSSRSPPALSPSRSPSTVSKEPPRRPSSLKHCFKGASPSSFFLKHCFKGASPSSFFLKHCFKGASPSSFFLKKPNQQTCTTQQITTTTRS